jgi:hypothetical protein
VNQQLEQNIAANETIFYDYTAKGWGWMAHFTPEYFGGMFGQQKDTQLFSFRNGLAWSHHNVVNPPARYLNYYLQQCSPVIGVVTNQGGTDEKTFLGNQVYCREILFILERLATSMGQQSRVYEGQWEIGEGFWSAPYLCDTANPDGSNPVQDLLMDGDSLYGRWLKALYIPNQYNGEYFILTAIISYFVARQKGN